MTSVKIQCVCGQRYAFDVEPVDGKMPTKVACPVCGADGTGAANDLIAESLASEAPARSGSRLRLSVAAAAPVAQAPPPPIVASSRVVRPPIGRKKSQGTQIGGIIGAIVGIAVGRYCGVQILIPLAGALVVGWLLKQISAGPSQFRAALAIQAGQALWMAVGAIVLGAWSKVALDIVVITAGLIWLWLSPGIGAVLLLGIYQLVAVAINIALLLQAEVGSVPHKALVAHVFIRTCALALLASGYIKLRKERSVV